MLFSYKRIFALLSVITISIISVAMPVSVDENIEFISAVCRLAGFDEYSDNTNKSYTEHLDSVMTPFSGHAAVEYLRNLRRTQYVGYDAIAALAVHTEMSDGHLILKNGADVAQHDERWLKGQAEKLLPLLDDLYQCSNFRAFYDSNSDLYTHAISNANQLLADCDLEWLGKFFGKEISGSRVVLSLLNRGNYGMTQKIDGQPDKSVIIICCMNLDENGYPVFLGQNSLIVHESSHPVCNPLVISNICQFNDNIELAAELMSDELSSRNYSGGESMMCESMVRSMELQYALSHENDSAVCENYMRNQMAGGFVFMPEIRNALEIYNSDRNSYPIIDSIMPLIIENINRADVVGRYREIKNGSPKVLGSSLEEGVAGIEASDSLEIRFYFDQPIQRGSFGMDSYDDNDDIIPTVSKLRLSEDGRTFSVFVVAEPGKEYGFTMHGAYFRGMKGYPGHGDVDVHFYTRP